jgi:hypothetical protein
VYGRVLEGRDAWHSSLPLRGTLIEVDARHLPELTGEGLGGKMSYVAYVLLELTIFDSQYR